MKLVFATHNRGKLAELRALVGDGGARAFTVLSLDELGVHDEVVEDGLTFADNARKKADAALARTGLPSLADDSGLEVDALLGAPGVDSAIYAGLPSGSPGADAANNARLLRELAPFPFPRRARFRCVLALALPGQPVVFEEGALEGEILDQPRGGDGFGYDPLFLVPALGKTSAELSLAEKNRVSHRGQALRKMAARLASLGSPLSTPP